MKLDERNVNLIEKFLIEEYVDLENRETLEMIDKGE